MHRSIEFGAMALCIPALCHAQAPLEVPQWEFGLGVVPLSIPHYRGSDERSLYVLPFPYFVYRGPLLKADREGARLDFIRADRLRVDLSASAGPPSRSSDGGARADMPKLDATIELGAALKVLLWQSPESRQAVSINLPIRAAFATDLTFLEPIGWIASPNVSYQIVGTRGWQTGVTMGPLFATERYHDYFYEVAPQYATATRPTYDASGGYSGSFARLTLSKRYARFWVGAFVRYDNLRGAVFEDSPLVRQDYSFMWGAGIAWVFAQSERTVPHFPEMFR